MMLYSGLALLCAFAEIKAQEGYSRDYPSNPLSYNSNDGYYNSPRENDFNVHGDEIPGVAGRDYPTFHEVPQTQFQCGQQQYPGYYADTEANCQVFHICQQNGHKDSFLCPNGTLFNQQRLVCEWWNQVDCSLAKNFYSVNDAIARAMAEATKLSAERKDGYRYDSSRNQNGSPQKLSQVDRHYLEPVNHPSQNINAPTPSSVYGVPDISVNSLPATSGRYDSSYNTPSQNYKVTGASFGKQNQNNIREPDNIYLPA